MGEPTPEEFPVLEDGKQYLIEVEVYGWPDGEQCKGSYIENTECIRTGLSITTWWRMGQECLCEEGLCPFSDLCASQRIVKITAM